MSYYQGDFGYGGMAGDPGFGSFFGKVFKGIGRLAGFGGGATKVIQVAAPTLAGKVVVPRVGGAIISRGAQVIRAGGRVIAKHPVLSAAGAAGAIGAAAGAGVEALGAGGMPMRGFHVSRRTGQLVKNRRMRVTNPRALRRAIRRATGFARLARRVLHFTSPRPPRGRAIFKARRGKMSRVRV